MRALVHLILPAFLLGAAITPAAEQPDSTTDAEVRAVLTAQEQAWNRGDIDGFMQGYAKSDDTIFAGSDFQRGWQNVRDRYAKIYDTREKMGTLTFSDLKITLLSPDTALVFGQWQLQRAKDHPHGWTTLILRKLPTGWRIVHDHSSAAKE
ncbi:MAG: SgcJ/EcaC family oxidoreductase [Verrucomicrobiota bacterium]|nr:SgcJ/EcaC family oxidoreductase [Verrucomicrobiota bacterium]